MSFSNPFFENLLKIAKNKQLIANLSVGEPFEKIPEIIKKSAVDSIINDKNTYSPAEGLPALRELLATKVRERNHIQGSDENILVTSGVSAGYDLALLTVLSPGDEVVIFDPYFPSFKEVARILGFEPVIVSTKENFDIDFEQLKASLTIRTKAIIINSPNNPTGKVYPKEDLLKLVELAKEKNFYIISDEIYEDFIYEGKHFSIGSIYPKTITLFGFSKTYSMTGWRLGYCVAPKELIEKMVEIQRYLFYAPSTTAQYGAAAFDEVDVSEKIKNSKERRDYVVKNLSKRYELNYNPQGAFYVFPKLPDGLKSEEFCMKALEAGVLVFPGSLFSQKDDYFRISYSTDLEKIKKGLEILNSLYNFLR